MQQASLYRLCSKCVHREGGTGFERAGAKSCYICQGLMDKAGVLGKKAARAAKRYEGSTFVVGIAMPPGVQEREDELRSTLKIKGGETIKVQLSREVAEEVALETGKTVDRKSPDLTLVIDGGTGAVAARARSVFFHGRYSKPRGVPQRKEPCQECRGRGCIKCKWTGYRRGDTVESLIGRRLLRTSGGESAKFMWIGSEDRESEVAPPGRPFVVEIKSPKRRKAPKRFALRSRKGRLEVSSGKVLPSKPRRLPSFMFRTVIRASAKGKVDREGLRSLTKTLHDADVVFHRPHDRPVVKKVYRMKAKATRRTLIIDALLDGGLPVKRLVSGDLVSPSVSEVLKTEVRCRTFDICKVTETSGFEFA